MQLTGLSRPSIYNLLQEAIHTGIFSVRRAGAKYLVSRDGFLAWLGKAQRMGSRTTICINRPALPNATEYIFYNQLYFEAIGKPDRQQDSIPYFRNVRGGQG